MPKRLPAIPVGLTVREKLLFVKTPLTAGMLAAGEVEAFLTAAREYCPLAYYVLFLLALRAGLR